MFWLRIYCISMKHCLMLYLLFSSEKFQQMGIQTRMEWYSNNTNIEMTVVNWFYCEKLLKFVAKSTCFKQLF